MADDDCARAVRGLYGCSWRQGLLSLLCVALVAGGALLLRRNALLALFGAILVPGFVACALLLLAARLLGRRLGWTGAAGLLLFATGVGAWAVLPAYKNMLAAWDVYALPDQQLLACAFGVNAAMLGLPLWFARTRAHAQQLAELRHVALAAELKALQAQVEPHFLYNTLANTRYLARHQPPRAVEMLEHLIAYLHSALPDMRSQTSTLGREFELAGHYLALMAIRFGERLQYRLDFPPALAAMPMPPLLLMTLVENAVRHGVEPKPGSVRIDVTACRAGATLSIVVTDDGAGIEATALGSGVGLRNLRQRVQALYGARAGFVLRRAETGLTEAVLTLPVAGDVELAA
ncbi:sensor histidine kinase [Massilia luteola]|uniref:sensor histidine kinase n=1 Tax=Massilia luteola TaxID=3081751 RepID=UPI002ACC250B|nr:histidine kinase [Massilia sp. Gc5]